jgi:hypothetical protein
MKDSFHFFVPEKYCVKRLFVQVILSCRMMTFSWNRNKSVNAKQDTKRCSWLVLPSFLFEFAHHHGMSHTKTYCQYWVGCQQGEDVNIILIWVYVHLVLCLATPVFEMHGYSSGYQLCLCLNIVYYTDGKFSALWSWNRAVTHQMKSSR